MLELRSKIIVVNNFKCFKVEIGLLWDVDDMEIADAGLGHMWWGWRRGEMIEWDGIKVGPMSLSTLI